jgi:hypothetical protein
MQRKEWYERDMIGPRNKENNIKQGSYYVAYNIIIMMMGSFSSSTSFLSSSFSLALDILPHPDEPLSFLPYTKLCKIRLRVVATVRAEGILEKILPQMEGK